jgi:hypothetical protein
LNRRRGRCFTPRPPRTPALNSRAAITADEAVDQLNAAFDTYMRHEALADARRVGRELRRIRV